MEKWIKRWIKGRRGELRDEEVDMENLLEDISQAELEAGRIQT